MIDSQVIKKVGRTIFGSMTFLGAFGPSNLEYFWWWYLFLVTVLFGFSAYLIYWCERFVVFLWAVVLAAVIALTYLVGSFAYLSSLKNFDNTNLVSVALGFTLAAIVFVTFLVIFFSRSSFFPFECVGNKVEVRAKKNVTKKYNLWLISGVSTLTGSMFLGAVDTETSDMVVIIGLTGLIVIILLHLRHTIRGLRTLHIRERKMPTPFTFMEIDEIREARSRWWLGRLFKWMGSLRQSTGS
jgi:hypothetical protein